MSFTFFITFFVLALVIIEAIFLTLVLIHRKSFPWIILEKDLYPIFNSQLLEKYFETSFDQQLGWARKPGTTGVDKSPDGDAKFNISSDGSRYNPEFQSQDAKIAVYGDSFSFCRLVNDDETWPYFLSKALGENVLNYGVGNYGLDQAYLRFLGHLPPQKKRKIVIIGVVPETILRTHSKWKHFLEYGNILAFKPSFELCGHHIRQNDNPIQNIKDFRNIRKVILSLSKSDPFYEQKFRRDVLFFPICISLFKSPRRIIKLLWFLTSNIQGNGKKKAFSVVLAENQRLQNLYYKSAKNVSLLEKLVESFAKSAKNNNIQPVLLVMPQPNDLLDVKKGEAVYQEVFQQFNAYLPVNDMTELFLRSEKSVDLYKSGDLGAHTSPELNKKIAAGLKEFIQNRFEHKRFG